MNERWQALMRPLDDDRVETPNEGEAFGIWILGLLWALACLWLGYLGGPWVVPGALSAGLLALWGWKHMEWLWWFPTVLVVATLIEPFSPLPVHVRFGPLVYIDLLTVGVAVVAIARAIGLRRRLLPRISLDPLVLLIVVLFVLAQFSAEARARALIDGKTLVVALIVFYASATVASRPRGSRWIWVAFPLASALIGAHALWAWTLGDGLLVDQLRDADRVWGTTLGTSRALLVALPVTLGLAASAGQARARAVWMVASACGVAGLVLHGLGASIQVDLAGLSSASPMAWIRKVMAVVTLLTLTRMAWTLRSWRPQEGPRWFAVAFVFAVSAIIELGSSVLAGPAMPLLGVAGGLVAGTVQADRRARRRADAPVDLEKAA